MFYSRLLNSIIIYCLNPVRPKINGSLTPRMSLWITQCEYSTAMPQTFRQVRPSEFEQIVDFYKRVVEALEGREHHPGWTWEHYPTVEGLKCYVDDGHMWAAERDGQLVGVVNLNSDVPPGYERIPWLTDHPVEAVLAVHTLAVSPDHQGQGVGTRLVRDIITHAAREGYRSIRLDVYPVNETARRLYESTGFSYLGQHELIYDGFGAMQSHIYEYVL